MKNLIQSPARTGLFIFVSLFLAGCPSKLQRVSNKPVEKVNDHVLSAKEFGLQLARRLKNFDALAAKDPNTVYRVKEDILRAFLVKSLTLDWARANSLVISESVLDAEVDKLRAHYPDDLSFRRALAQENLSFSEWRDELRYSLIEKEVFKSLNSGLKPLADDEVRRYYDEHKDTYKRKERIYLRQIVVADEARADILKVDLKTKDFATLAKKYSTTPEGKNGGVVGWIEKGTVDFFDPLFSAGSSLQTIKSPFGVHLVKVERKAPAGVATLDEVKNQIISTLRGNREQAAYVAWLDAQLRSSKVLKDYDLIHSITVDTRGSND